MTEPTVELERTDAAEQAGADLLERERQRQRRLHPVVTQREAEQPVREVEREDHRHPAQQRLPAWRVASTR